MQVRVLQPGDEAMLTAAVALADEGPLDRVQAAAHLADTDKVIVVAVDGDAVAGFAYGHILRRFETTSFFLYSIDVAEAWQRRGIATAMLATLQALGRSGRWHEMFVFTNRSNAAAMALYRKCGGVQFVPDDVVMFDFAG